MSVDWFSRTASFWHYIPRAFYDEHQSRILRHRSFREWFQGWQEKGGPNTELVLIIENRNPYALSRVSGEEKVNAKQNHSASQSTD
jgi:hypothetical protein